VSTPGGALHPPLAPLLEVHARLDRAGIAHALGASGLLFALGLWDHVGDWDINVEADHDVLGPLFAPLKNQDENSDSQISLMFYFYIGF
jgi:hypothetical protein